MKSTISLIIGPVILVAASATLVFAKPVLSDLSTSKNPLLGLQFAQANLTSLTDSELRRMNFYTGRALDALAALAAEDSLSGDAGSVISGDTVRALQDAINRLADAGKRSGLSLDDVADFFYVAVVEQFSQDIPLALQDATGAIDTRSLFAGVVGRTNFSEEQSVDTDYLALLNEESSGLNLGLEEVSAPVVEDVIATAGPLLRDGADAATRAIVGRVVVEGDVWRIRVISGDTLATYAFAIYGNSLAYRQIFLENQNLLSNANSLSVGQVLTIPKP